MPKYAKEKVFSSLTTAKISGVMIHRPYNSAFGSNKIKIEKDRTLKFYFKMKSGVNKKAFGLIHIINLL